MKLDNFAKRDLRLLKTVLHLRYETTPEQMRWILTKLRDGASLAHACAAAVRDNSDPSQWTAQLRQWFSDWTELGWFCARSRPG